MSKYVLDPCSLGIFFCPTKDKGESWILQEYSDCDYAEDIETRLLVGGFILYIYGVPVS